MVVKIIHICYYCIISNSRYLILSTIKMANLFECDQCDYKSKSKATLVLHHNSLHENMKHKCDTCGHQFSTKSNLTKHQKSIHQGSKFPCDTCDYQATGRGSLKNTSSQYMKERNFPVAHVTIRQVVEDT